jgi:protoheme IX farnesyltransferase
MDAARPLAADARDAGLLRCLVQLVKPAITRLVMVTMLCGALAAPAKIHWLNLIIALFGTALVVGSANALNMYLERDLDGLMKRTRNRPLPAGRLAPEVALAFGIALGVAGLVLLLLLVSPLVALLNAVALGSYVLVYTPLKRITPWALHAGAVPGALPPLIGWAAVTHGITLVALVPFAILFFWQLPHFLAISLFRREEYAQAGLKVLSVTRGVTATRRAIVAYAAALLAVTLLPVVAGLGGWIYLAFALPPGVLFVIYAIRGLGSGADERWARRLFLLSLPHLVLVFSGLVVASLVG